jgi:peptidoglycan/xylan/chitin deacetylase (PgdA/CDA1 family)
VDRRRFLTLLGVGAAGGAGGFAGGVLGHDAITRPTGVELTDGAGPHGPNLGSHRVIWSVVTTERRAAITFDDGPDPEFTPKIVEILGRYNVRGTFNVMGYNAVKHADILKATVAAGHEIGNHTWTHLDLAYQSPQETLRQLRRGAEAIEDISGVETRFFRPPRGELTGAAARYAAQLGYDILLWSVSRGVPGVGTAPAVAREILDRLSPGAILGLHDGIGRGTFNRSTPGADLLRKRRQVEVQALPRVLEGALQKGIALGTVTELLAVEAVPGGEASGHEG